MAAGEMYRCGIGWLRSGELLPSEGTLQSKHVGRVGYHLHVSDGCQNPILANRSYAGSTAYGGDRGKLDGVKPVWQVGESKPVPFEESGGVAL